jgi:hypothetical protein
MSFCSEINLVVAFFHQSVGPPAKRYRRHDIRGRIAVRGLEVVPAEVARDCDRSVAVEVAVTGLEVEA